MIDNGIRTTETLGSMSRKRMANPIKSIRGHIFNESPPREA
jgi:hypothetical protein